MIYRHSLRGSVDWNATTTVPCCTTLVTPCVGVWIEISSAPAAASASATVTPCVGVWIEIVFSDHPDLEPGKVTPCVGVWIEITSFSDYKVPDGVTPCVGVWIEIIAPILLPPSLWRHSLRGSVDWNPVQGICMVGKDGHSLRGSVDWNTWNITPILNITRHSLRGSVDWNNVYVNGCCYG